MKNSTFVGQSKGGFSSHVYTVYMYTVTSRFQQRKAFIAIDKGSDCPVVQSAEPKLVDTCAEVTCQTST